MCFIECQLDFDDGERALGREERPCLACDAERGFIDGDDVTSCAPSTYAASTADFHTQDDPYASILRSLPRARAAAVQRGRARRAAGGLRRGWGVDCDDANGAREPGHGDDIRWGWGGRAAPAPMMYADARTASQGSQAAYALPAQTDRDNDELAARRAGGRGRKRCRASLPPSASHLRIHALLTPYPPSFAPISTRAGGLRPRQAAVKR
ncbi:hypothetical protein B0H14DRAFT_3177151 [Mycena olivaceomarginata]|nr:hypothetical protein B0H14DRAFT_3177151 [Mycena olivaceomarginata]